MVEKGRSKNDSSAVQAFEIEGTAGMQSSQDLLPFSIVAMAVIGVVSHGFQVLQNLQNQQVRAVPAALNNNNNLSTSSQVNNFMIIIDPTTSKEMPKDSCVMSTLCPVICVL